MQPSPPAWARHGIAQLCAQDADFARVLGEAGPLPWRTRPQGFEGLLHAIIAQQISAQAASAIWARLTALPGALEPAQFLHLAPGALLGCGLSRPKLRYAQALAAAFASSQLNSQSLAAMPDAQVLTALTALPGIGPWSAEIYLLFALERADIMPAADIALQGAWADLKSLPARPSPARLRALTQPYAPHRSLAARMLWHWWRHITGRPSTDDLQPR